MNQLDEKIRNNCLDLAKNKIIFCEENARAHKNVLNMGKINDLKYELFEHPLHSTDLTPSDFHLFSNLIKRMHGNRFSTNEEMITAVEAYLSVSGFSLQGWDP